MKIFILKNCPHCINLKRWIDELYQENPIYREVEITYIDEQEHMNIAEMYDYYYVPSIYVNEKKVHEGVASKEIMKTIFKQVQS